MSEFTPSAELVRDSYVGCHEPKPGETQALRAEFERWHAAELRRAKAEAWDEALQSFAGQVDEVQSMWIEDVTNPYRDQLEEDQ